MVGESHADGMGDSTMIRARLIPLVVYFASRHIIDHGVMGTVLIHTADTAPIA